MQEFNNKGRALEAGEEGMLCYGCSCRSSNAHGEGNISSDLIRSLAQLCGAYSYWG